ncbi:abortive infection family protein [Corynebacterium silvaticum]|uniref:Abortive infection family protein n=1 Tax=Corynebacterium silvaticum TaxID=2320431 RepID=A0A7Y4LG47_9CORY|nr:abortive infection family protein [Corynebacterium silvaticum]ARU46385.1 abortive infection family protein [Corynebacterium silvaticum]MBH5299522.1 abortive infection family protein [Corynebacterium silvaticum]NOM64159.1 abortive infection family protein [Corynebacterium silvaticum]NON69366.1 abortive infection family protein [Corynebacterium silvaticum]TFA94005.1 hypothetical protein EU802_01260 [Corynebacterium silvaticum]
MSSQKFSRRTLSAFRQLTTQIPIRSIETAFEDEGFTADPLNGYEDSSERRVRTEQYLSAIVFDDPLVYPRLIRAMEVVLEPIAPCHTPGTQPSDWAPFVKYMREDGWIVDETGSISALLPSAAALVESMTTISDISGIEEGITRLQTLTDDPAASIGAAKELMESTAKVLLQELGVNFDSKTLINTVHTKLGLDPSSNADVDSATSLKRILGGAKSVALGLAEFRNAGYGTGHGQPTARRGLGPRHARLAIHAAVLWCDLVLSTFTDPAAPWRK